MIHICFCLHDKTGRYAKFTGTAMLSLFENTDSNVTVHLLHDNTLTSDNRDKFSYVAGQFNQLVKFYNVEELCADKINAFWQLIPAIKTSWSGIGTFFKLLIPKVLPVDIAKCIYLDSDMLVNLDIKELWKTNLDDKPLAAVPEIEATPQQHTKYSQGIIKAGFVKFEDYFNSGMLVMNLNFLRGNEELLMSGVKWRGEHQECWCFDNDIWNYLFSKNYVELPAKFNIFVRDARVRNEKKILQAIYHFAGMEYGLDSGDPFNRLWLKYFVKTPWFDEETIGRLFADVQKMHIELKQSLVNLSAMMSGKTRAFFTPPRDVDGLKKFFSIRDDEEIILAENQASLQKLLDAMNASRGKKVFFIMLPAFPFQALIQAGFVPNSDFVNGLEFLSEAQGLPLNSYPLIKAM